MPLYVENGKLIYERSKKGQPPKVVLVECAIPGCSEVLPEPEFDAHLLFHPEPVEPEPVTLQGEVDEEGVYSVTSMQDA